MGFRLYLDLENVGIIRVHNIVFSGAYNICDEIQAFCDSAEWQTNMLHNSKYYNLPVKDF